MPSPYKDIGNRLVVMRDVLGIKQAELCKAIKVAQNRMSQYESGERRITLPVAIKLADTYGITLDWIYRGEASGLPHHLHRKIHSAA